MADPQTCCPRCKLPLHHRQPDPAFYPGATFSYICGAELKDGETCHQKITVEMKR